jgi:hypothetical protein
VADLYKCWVLHGKGIVNIFRAALLWTDCDIERVIGINVGFCLKKKLQRFRAALTCTDSDSEWLIGINGGFCVEKKL